jgi:hypothetical protein
VPDIRENTLASGWGKYNEHAHPELDEPRRTAAELLKMPHGVGVKVIGNEDGAHDCVTFSYPWIPTLTRR